MSLFQLNVFEFTDLEDLQIFIKRYIYLVSPVLPVIYFLLQFAHNTTQHLIYQHYNSIETQLSYCWVVK